MAMTKVCETCGKPHRSPYRHLCQACYSRQRRADPERAEKDRAFSRAWKARNSDANKARGRAYRKSLRVECECGNLKEPSASRCRSCVSAAAKARDDQIVEMYDAGVPLAEIAEILGTTIGTISVQTHYLRNEGRIGYRYQGWAG